MDYRVDVFYEWLDDTKPGWVLKENAPEEARDAYNDYMKEKREAWAKGIIID